MPRAHWGRFEPLDHLVVGHVYDSSGVSLPVGRCTPQSGSLVYLLVLGPEAATCSRAHHRRGFTREPSVALYQFAKLSRAFLAVWAALLARRFCPDRAAVIVSAFLAAETEMMRSRPRPVHPLLMGLALVPLVIAFVLLLEWLLG